MKILAIESSCDDSGIAILEDNTKDNQPKMLANLVSSQIKIHAKWGGVVPMLAKREHQRNLLPLLKKALKESKLLEISKSQIPRLPSASPPPDSQARALRAGQVNGGQAISKQISNSKIPARLASESVAGRQTLNKILEREPELLKKLLPFLKKYQKPDIDYIAVTHGPGLEPALWVGVNLAKALSFIWGLPILPINHIEGHIAANSANDGISGMTNDKFLMTKKLPAMCLIVSGGHTQLILTKDSEKHISSLSGNHPIPVSSAGETLASIRASRSGPPFARAYVSPGKSFHLNYQIIGETRDDAAGEAFDKVAKMLGLGYPGGPAISKLASKWDSITLRQRRTRLGRESLNRLITEFSFPRPMLNSSDFDFSFSGLKTAVLYTLQKMTKTQIKKVTPAIAAAFQQAVIDVLVQKTINAAKKYGAKSIWLAGGVAANQALRQRLEQTAQENNFSFMVPPNIYCADNAGMIALAAFYQLKQNRAKEISWQDLKAEPNLRIS